MTRHRKETLTARQRQSQQIMHAKNARRRRRLLARRCVIAGGGVLMALLVIGGAWLWQSQAGARLAGTMADGVYALTARGGFAVQSLYLEGRNRTDIKDIQRALGLKKGDPILRLSLSQMRERLETIGSVKLASVERSLPGAIHVRIVEREPLALWQHQGKITLVDDGGALMSGVDIAPYRHLPLIIGDNAPARAQELMEILKAEPELARDFSAAIRVGDRRWNIRLSGHSGGDIEIRLPESQPVAAWKRLARAQAKERLLDRDVKVIDLRLEEKMFIKTSPAAAPGRSSSARET